MKLPSVRTYLVLPALLTHISCSAEPMVQPPEETETMAVGAPVTGNVSKNGNHRYAVSVSAGAVYTVVVSDLTDDAELNVFEDSAFSRGAPCLIDHRGWNGTTDEGCTVPAAHTTLYIDVYGSHILGASANYTITVHAVPRAELTVSTPVAGTVSRGEAMAYVADVVPGTTYVASATSLTDSTTWISVSGYSMAWSRNEMSPKEWSFVARDSRVYLAIDGLGVSGPSASYVIMVTPAPVIADPIVGTSGNVLIATPTIGYVEGLRESFYRTDGMTPGDHRVSVVGLTSPERLGLRIFTDTLNTIEAACTSSVSNARECTVSGTSAHFSVRSENSTGAGYVLLVW